MIDSGSYEGLAYSADKAVDGHVNTMWVSKCGMHSTTGQPCRTREARIGMDFGRDNPDVVLCVIIHQSYAYKSSRIELVRESASGAVGGDLWVSSTIFHVGRCSR